MPIRSVLLILAGEPSTRQEALGSVLFREPNVGGPPSTGYVADDSGPVVSDRLDVELRQHSVDGLRARHHEEVCGWGTGFDQFPGLLDGPGNADVPGVFG